MARLSCFFVATLALTFSADGRAWATPCVGADYDIPLPGATDVTTHLVDVPSARFPGLWQEGRKDGFDYAIFANGDALIEMGVDSLWRINLSCESQSCAQQTEGTPPEAAVQLANQLQQCILEGEITPVAEAPSAEPSPPPVAVENQPAEDVIEPDAVPTAPEEREACGEETIEDDNPARKLQLMLVLAGADPGPADGILGDKTTRALLSVLGETANQLSTNDAIDALQTKICPDSN